VLSAPREVQLALWRNGERRDVALRPRIGAAAAAA
jgi:hypothetical protein